MNEEEIEGRNKMNTRNIECRNQGGHLIFSCRAMSWFSWFCSSLRRMEVVAITASFLVTTEEAVNDGTHSQRE